MAKVISTKMTTGQVRGVTFQPVRQGNLLVGEGETNDKDALKYFEETDGFSVGGSADAPAAKTDPTKKFDHVNAYGFPDADKGEPSKNEKTEDPDLTNDDHGVQDDKGNLKKSKKAAAKK